MSEVPLSRTADLVSWRYVPLFPVHAADLYSRHGRGVVVLHERACGTGCSLGTTTQSAGDNVRVDGFIPHLRVRTTLAYADRDLLAACLGHASGINHHGSNNPSNSQNLALDPAQIKSRTFRVTPIHQHEF